MMRVLVAMFLLLMPGIAAAWGSMAHGFLTGAAVDRLDGPLGRFFGANRDFLVCYSVLPDSWWGSVDLLPQLPKGLEMPAGKPGDDELERHFHELDQEAYLEFRRRKGIERHPVMTRSEALAIFQDFVRRRGKRALAEFKKLKPKYRGGMAGLPRAMMRNGGMLPWALQERVAMLSAAMRARDWNRVLLLATVVGHYVSDAHVPLHTAVNYDGKLSGQKGVHARWEARMLERNEEDVKAHLERGLRAPRPRRLLPSEVPERIFAILNESFALAPKVLGADARLAGDKTYGDSYYERFYAEMGPLAKERLWLSAEEAARLWDLAWRMAGSPRLPAGKIETPALVVIDFKRDRIIPYDPVTGPRE